MGALKERVKLDMSVFGGGPVDFFANNVSYMYDLYENSREVCPIVPKENIVSGGFYHLHYMDDSNWVRYSPIFVAEHKRMGNMIVLLAVNLNFIPLELRVDIFDPFITEKDYTKGDVLLEVDFPGMYGRLLRFGFEYALMEYNVAQVKLAHRVTLPILSRFLWSAYPVNKYDPNALMRIWKKKIETKEQRHQEIIRATLDEFYDIKGEMSEKYDVLSGHIDRLQKSFTKYGRP
jgi:hypothetical protein